ncbi:MAG TPA: IS481 family transposase [Burkholderiales bacterium]|nr:IS481 family transposase [Burkholderiales bacterium]
MNMHKNARLTFARRIEMVQSVVEHGVTLSTAAAAQQVSVPTVRKWVSRFLLGGEAALADRSSRPQRSPLAISEAKALAILELRRRRLTMQRIAKDIGCSMSTVSRLCARAGLSHLPSLEPAAPIQRYEYAHPGDLLHIDIKKLGRIGRMGYRVTGDQSKRARGVGWEFFFVGVDDHARIAVTQLHADERVPSAIQFLEHAVTYFQDLGVTVRRVMTDNGGAFRAKLFKRACDRLGIKHIFTRAYTPRTNGKAERFIQSALREWAYGFAYNHSSERLALLKQWIHHYNWHRPHQGIGGIAPMQRLPMNRNNLLHVHT